MERRGRGKKYKTSQVFIYLSNIKLHVYIEYSKFRGMHISLSRHFLTFFLIWFARWSQNQLLHSRFTLKYLQVCSPPLKEFMCSLSSRTQRTHSKGERTYHHASLFRLGKQTLATKNTLNTNFCPRHLAVHFAVASLQCDSIALILLHSTCSRISSPGTRASPPPHMLWSWPECLHRPKTSRPPARKKRRSRSPSPTGC
jgi:hypothetical protein